LILFASRPQTFPASVKPSSKHNHEFLADRTNWNARAVATVSVDRQLLLAGRVRDIVVIGGWTGSAPVRSASHPRRRPTSGRAFS
jgi:hypothetical protein